MWPVVRRRARRNFVCNLTKVDERRLFGSLLAGGPGKAGRGGHGRRGGHGPGHDHGMGGANGMPSMPGSSQSSTQGASFSGCLQAAGVQHVQDIGRSFLYGIAVRQFLRCTNLC